MVDKGGEVVKELVLGPQKVKLVVALLPVHEVRQKRAAIAGNELRCELDDVEIDEKHGGRVKDELRLVSKSRGLILRHTSLTVLD